MPNAMRDDVIESFLPGMSRWKTLVTHNLQHHHHATQGAWECVSHCLRLESADAQTVRFMPFPNPGSTVPPGSGINLHCLLSSCTLYEPGNKYVFPTAQPIQLKTLAQRRLETR